MRVRPGTPSFDEHFVVTDGIVRLADADPMSEWDTATECPEGHRFTVANTKAVVSAAGRPNRWCRACDREREARRRPEPTTADIRDLLVTMLDTLRSIEDTGRDTLAALETLTRNQTRTQEVAA